MISGVPPHLRMAWKTPCGFLPVNPHIEFVETSTDKLADRIAEKLGDFCWRILCRKSGTEIQFGQFPQ
jgi:hypothetical protein